MKNIKFFVLGGIFAGFSVLFQILPAFLSEVFAILTIFSALPIYMMCRIKPLAGINTFLSASILIFIISPHEGVFFIFTNGIIGLSLGLCKYYFENRDLMPVFIGSLVLAASLGVLSIALGIKVFGFALPLSLALQIVFIFAFSIVYCSLYVKLANLIYKRILKLII